MALQRCWASNLALWAGAAAVRALKTAAQTAVAMIPVGVAVTDVGWPAVLGTAALAALCSLLTSVAGVPEVDDGSSVAALTIKEG